MRRFLLGWKSLGHAERLRAQIVNYADDFVICCRGTAEEALQVMRSMMERLKLTVNETKTRVCRLPEETFDFLGYTIGRCYSTKTGKAYLGTRPSKKRITRLCRAISEETRRRWTLLEAHDRVAKLNRMLSGWGELLLFGTCEQGLPDRGRPRPASAPSVVVCQTQGQGSGDLTIPG